MANLKVITRSELFDAVWAQRLEAAAEKLGVTPAELKKVCRRHHVPVPALSYWLQVEAGKTFPKPPLSAVARRLEQVRLETQSAPPTKALKASTRSKGRSGTSMESPKASAPLPPARDAKQPDGEPEPSKSPGPAPKIAVASRLHTPHRIIAAWIEEDRRDRERWGRSFRTPETPEAKALERRRLLILDALFKTLEKRGHKVETERGSIRQAHLLIDGQRIDYVLSERIAQRRVPLTKAELADPHNIRQRRQWRQLREPTGKLQLTFRVGYDKKAWNDQDGAPLESQLVDVIIGAEAMAANEKAERARRDELERLRQQESLRKYEQQQLEKRNANQWRRLRELAGRHDEAGRMRAFIAEMRVRTGASVDAELEAWFKWAEELASAWDPLTRGVPHIANDVREITEWDYRS